ncbi:hypothetical protein RB195_018152 [Necator americanus]|uniref:PH domain protein n=1 Tax=Necator americanus TaxID=51031 RepID=A0ABR1C8F2_NECAM
MDRKQTVAVLNKLSLTAHSTFYSFEEVSDTPPAIKAFKRITLPPTAKSSVPKKISDVSTASIESTKSASGRFSYLAGDVPSALCPLLPLPGPNLSRSNSSNEFTSDSKRKKNSKLRRRPAVKLVLPRRKTSRFYAPILDSPIHLPQTEMFQHFSGMPPDPDVMMEGYLYKRSSNAFKTWNRRWFQIKDNKLLYSHRSADSEQPTVMEENLMLCLVRPAPSSIDRVGCFELVTPTRSHLLQADSEALCNDWMRALQRTILALHESDEVETRPSSFSKSESRKVATDVGVSAAHVGASSVPDSTTTFEQIRRVPGNERCADCGSEQPKWVSINLGVVLCIECSGVHRSLGVQTSKVRSLTMDSIDPELRDVLLSLGNSQVNAIFLAHLPDKDIVPQPAVDNSSRQVREAWIKAKYVERRFAVSSCERARSSAAARKEHLIRHRNSLCGISSSVHRSTSYSAFDVDLIHNTDTKEAVNGFKQSRMSSCGSDPSIGQPDTAETTDWEVISEAARCGDVLGLLRCVAAGADINCARSGTTALHIATRNGQTAAVEFLLLNGAKINVLDDKLNTPLHLAAAEGNTLQVCQLLKRGADKSLKNADGVTPLEIAVDGKHADIVTLFRVHTMRDEFNEEFNNPMDDTVDSVISDITRKAAVSKSSSG